MAAEQHYDTIVVGAGIAGLAFASRLLQANHTANAANRLRVLEARDRIGGRIASVHVRNCRLDTGANWIHGTGNAENPNPLMGIAPHKRSREMRGSVLFQAPSREHYLKGRNIGSTGECLAGDLPDPASHAACPATAVEDAKSAGGLSIPANLARLIVSSHQNALDTVQDLAATISAKDAKEMSALRALVDSIAFQSSFELVPREYHHELGALFQGMENMEAAPLVAETAEPGRPESEPGLGLLEFAVDSFDGEQAFLQDGYGAVVDELAKPIVEAGALSLETVVTRVDWTANPIVIETSQGNFTAREVVCTLPLGVLKDTRKDAMFTPELPPDKQDAIERLGFGTLDKVFAVYSRPWWNDELYSSALKNGLIEMHGQDKNEMPDSFLGFTSELSGISIGHDGSVSPDVYRLPVLNLHTLTDQPVLCAFVSCRSATTVEGMKDEDVGALFHRTLTRWFGTEPPRPDAVHVTRWAQDPYSRGAYSHMITGLSDASHKEALQVPLINEAGGVLRFAGEHCSRDHFAMVHGALLDGWRAADASLRDFQGL
ncbi:uncharacterized protein E0L32_000208 [Thyridium curvatum]|uniref:Amine oxidase domain-containing protein n=1 Tax=Thyridium curvatum TaxID=1093900 RepID=A0A507BB67_9PEZI|nr:uncharacterized protein E0L32_000208 [Thyridium curvatum]TPX15874.1 hypothetical protein E0L32_000208 [Thyridium curvatum]